MRFFVLLLFLLSAAAAASSSHQALPSPPPTLKSSILLGISQARKKPGTTKPSSSLSSTSTSSLPSLPTVASTLLSPLKTAYSGTINLKKNYNSYNSIQSSKKLTYSQFLEVKRFKADRGKALNLVYLSLFATRLLPVFMVFNPSILPSTYRTPRTLEDVKEMEVERRAFIIEALNGIERQASRRPQAWIPFLKASHNSKVNHTNNRRVRDGVLNFIKTAFSRQGLLELEQQYVYAKNPVSYVKPVIQHSNSSKDEDIKKAVHRSIARYNTKTNKALSKLTDGVIGEIPNLRSITSMLTTTTDDVGLSSKLLGSLTPLFMVRGKLRSYLIDEVEEEDRFILNNKTSPSGMSIQELNNFASKRLIMNPGVTNPEALREGCVKYLIQVERQLEVGRTINPPRGDEGDVFSLFGAGSGRMFNKLGRYFVGKSGAIEDDATAFKGGGDQLYLSSVGRLCLLGVNAVEGMRREDEGASLVRSLYL
jgi:hypothetical protein